jgi:hypothetical protein
LGFQLVRDLLGASAMIRSSLRWLLLLAPALGPLVFGACSSNTVTTTTRRQLDLLAETPSNNCDVLVVRVGQPSSFTLTANIATSTCTCQYQVDEADYPGGCSYHHCESSYDLGSDNPEVCADAGSAPPALTRSDATVDDPACNVTARVDPVSASQVIVTVLCRTVAATSVYVHAESPSAALDGAFFIRATTDGSCPPPPNLDGGTPDGS